MRHPNRFVSVAHFKGLHHFRSFSATAKQKSEALESTQTLQTDQSMESSTPTSIPLTREHLQRSFRRWQRWFTMRILFSIGLIGGALFYCWDHPNEIINLKNRISKIFSEVGTSTLSQKELQIQATEYSKQMICDVFNDASIQQQTKEFFISILSEQDFLNTLSVLLRDLFQRDIMIQSVQDLVINVFNDPMVIEQCKVLIGHAISAEENKQILMDTLHQILDDQELKLHAETVANDTVKQVLTDEEIKAMTAVFLQHVLTDDSVQQTTSESLYKVLVGAVTPNLFRRRKRDTDEEEEGVTTRSVQEEGVAIEKFENISDSISDHH